MQPVPHPTEAISLGAAARKFRTDGKPVSPSSVWRWARFGKHGVKLRAWPCGNKLVTSEAAVQQFQREVAEADARRWAERSGDTLPAPNQSDIEARAAALGI